jgi:site-specific DNA-cytosine methylase
MGVALYMKGGCRKEINMAIKILIGGSPCTKWSIAQTKDRETTSSGEGWELFKNFVIAKEKFKPDFFLYENVKSMSNAIKEEITKHLGVEPYLINSALVSAQNRERYYWTNIENVPQPEDRGILLKDILETGCPCRNEKAYCLDANYCKGGNLSNNKGEGQKIIEPVCVAQRGRYIDTGHRHSKTDAPTEQFYEARTDGKTNTLTTVQKDNMVAEPIALHTTVEGEAQCLRATYYKDGIRNLIANNVDRKTCIAEPIRVGHMNKGGQGDRIYSINGKSICLSARGGGRGAKTGLYAIPIEFSNGVPIKAINCADGKEYPVYEVKDGKITIKNKTYPIKLADGFYIIRKLTVTECCRLQTLPDDYCRVVSATQAYKGLGNGWTAEVIIHILRHANIPLDEEIIVLSMYDGIGTGRYCFDKMGYKNIKYYAYEIDEYPIKVAISNYPDIIQCGDAFKVREDDWKL